MNEVDLDAAMETTQSRELFQALDAVWPPKRAALLSTPAGTRLHVGMEGSAISGGSAAADFVLHVPRAAGTAGSDAAPSHRVDELRFSDDLAVPWPFRGRTVSCAVPHGTRSLALQPDERILLARGSDVLWTVRRSDTQTVWRCAFELPRLDAAAGLSAVLDARRLPIILPLLHALREAFASSLYTNPPLRASFVIDDPNLHWPRYGYVDYLTIAQRAERLNYHVGFATVPLDAWFTHRRTAEAFRSNGRRLSLLVHGNNHAKGELARPMNAAERSRMLDQAVSRIDHLQRASGLQVCKVMIPPHGACSADVLRDLPQHGFEGACISTGSLQAHNPGQAWTRTLGFAPTETVGGCPVMPRWALSDCSDTLLLAAAYLGRPLILRGHHQDLRRGLDALDAAAESINGIGPVIWGNLTELSRLNHQSRLEYDTLTVKPIGLKVNVRIPDAATYLAVEGAGDGAWTLTDARGVRPVPADGRIGLRDGGELLLLERSVPTREQLAESHWAGTRPLYVLRRFLAEARDRMLVS
jgi:hypothetical protein